MSEIPPLDGTTPKPIEAVKKIFVAIWIVLALTNISLGRTTDRITRAIDEAEVSVVKGNTHPWAQPRYDQGSAADTLALSHVTMMFKPSTSQQTSLPVLLQQLQDRSSPNYHKWLTPQEFSSQFGLSQNDMNKVVSWLESKGFSVKVVAHSHMWVVFSGTAGEIESAFHTEIHNYQINGQSYYANVSDPSVPAALANVVLGFRGLNNFRPHSRAIARRVPATANPHFTSSVTGDHYLAPNDVATIYDLNGLYENGLNGSGEKIAVMGQTDIETSDIDAFRSASGLPANDPTVVLIPGSPDPGISAGDIDEASLDVEWAGAMAPQADIIYVNSGTANGVYDSLQYAIDQDLAPIAVITYGLCEQQWDPGELQTLETQAQQANAEGMTIVAPSGDYAAADCDEPSNPNIIVEAATQGLAVDAPASLPEVTGVGGTEFNEGTGNYWNTSNNSSNGSALSYIPEVVWNDTNSTDGLEGSGGGASVVFSKPSWQTGTGVPNDNARDVPDLALDASPNHDGYLICSQGSCVSGFRASDQSLNVVGGTSVAAPIFAAILSLVNQETNSIQGNANYILYPLAAGYPTAFHDITQGNNDVPCVSGSPDCPSSLSFGYSAGPGYDQATGLGSVDASYFVMDWSRVSATSSESPDFQLSISPSSLSLTPGASGTAQVTVTGVNDFTGNVNFTCTVPSSLTATCSVSPSEVGAGKSTVLSVTSTQAATSGIVTPPTFSGFGLWPVCFVALICILLVVILSSSSAEVRWWGPISGLRWSPSESAHRRHRPYSLRISNLLWRRAALGLFVLCFVALSVSCGGGSGASSSSSSSSSAATQPASVTADVTVTGTSGTISHTIQVSVTLD